MVEILAENLSDKNVVGSDGAELGTLYNVTMSVKTGQIHDLLVEPGNNVPRDVDFPQDETGHFRIPVDRVQAVKDHVVVTR